MPSLAGFSASIIVDGEPLPEFGGELDVEGATLRRSVFVPSETGKRFQIHVKSSGGSGTHAVFEVFVDEREAGQFLLRHGKPERDIVGATGSNGERRPWHFARAQFVSDKDGAWARDLYNEQKRDGIPGGKIRIEVRNCIKTGSHPPDGPGWQHEDRPIHEKAKESSKLGLFTHTAVVGEPLADRVEWFITYKCCEDRPIAEFTFHYRSMDLLDANGITAAAQVKREGDQILPPKLKRYRVLDVEGQRMIDLEDELTDDEEDRRLDSGVAVEDDDDVVVTAARRIANH
ncbi:hypothetical protein DFJ74DRAFT_681106 [Hyaloraphidium curvatum]|nr:hypothetical protein DFJ74DRAFT_681106 [Hyaloraphidium curvatum]